MAAKLRKLKTLVPLADKPEIVIADTVRYRGKLWLVPKWLEYPAERCSRPERMVRIDHLAVQALDRSKGFPADFQLGVPIPTAVLRGPIGEGTFPEYEILLQPDAVLPWSETSAN